MTIAYQSALDEPRASTPEPKRTFRAFDSQNLNNRLACVHENRSVPTKKMRKITSFFRLVEEQQKLIKLPQPWPAMSGGLNAVSKKKEKQLRRWSGSWLHASRNNKDWKYFSESRTAIKAHCCQSSNGNDAKLCVLFSLRINMWWL